MTPRDRLLWEIREIMSEVGPDEFTDQELVDALAVMRPIRVRLTPDNVVHLTPRAVKPRPVRNRKQPARV